MESNVLTLLSNLIYLICGIILITRKKIILGCGLIIIWYISHLYHKDRSNIFWSNTDMVFASLGFLYIIIKHFNQIFCFNKLIFLLVVFTFYIISRLYDNSNNIGMYNIFHSFWHMSSAIFVTQILIEN